MNEHDIVAYGWGWFEDDIEPTEPVIWRGIPHEELAYLESSIDGDDERLFLRLRSGQVIRVKLKEQHA